MLDVMGDQYSIMSGFYNLYVIEPGKSNMRRAAGTNTERCADVDLRSWMWMIVIGNDSYRIFYWVYRKVRVCARVERRQENVDGQQDMRNFHRDKDTKIIYRCCGFDLDAIAIEVTSINSSDFTISAVVALYFLKCAVCMCDWYASWFA